MINYPDELNPVFDKLSTHHIKAIIVGGFVRDALLKISSKDIDIELYGVSSVESLEEILKEFGSVNSVGKSFGVCILSLQNMTIDFTLPRVDNKIAAGHTGFSVSISENMEFKTAASRRDFTMNAIGYDITTQKILDPFNGQKDLKEKILKEVNAQSFVEDPLRVLRAVQFCARFDLTMSSNLFSLCQSMVEKKFLDELSKERVFVEYDKLLRSAKPSIGFRLLKKLNILELENFDITLVRLDYFANMKTEDTQTHTLIMLTLLSLSLLEDETTLFLSQFTAQVKIAPKVLILKQSYKELSQMNKQSLKDSDLYRLAQRVKISELLLLAQVIEPLENQNKVLLKRAQKLAVLNEPLKALVNGKELIKLGYKPSKQFSKILNRAYQAQMNGEFSSCDEAIVWLQNI